MGHIMKDCPSHRAFIAAPDGNGYVSASDVADDLALAANIVADSEDDESEAIDSLAASVGFPSLLVQRVLSYKAEHEDEEKLQRKNLFYMFLIVKGCVFHHN
ncbi:putative retrotransposon protein [Panicum miliaceum]|uniref:Retrotransposon protein n=1 Tax=Panicum miliaceum TaxID=4540 RepID=A0A3L6QRF2_PANMI|nr:putative retrotransposon protein [Panicum miliaceum]